MKKVSWIKGVTGFIALFICYHAAEYIILYKNNAIAYLIIILFFFFVSWIIGKWQFKKGLQAWGITFNRSTFKYAGIGLSVGIVVYVLAFLTSIQYNIEVISFIPSFRVFILQSSLLIFGSFFSSLSEDVLTRTYLYQHLHNRVNKFLLVLISAAVYTFNHIHRLDEPLYLVYAFILGIQLIIPVLYIKNIWYTLGIHWAGNIVYHVTSNVMHTQNGTNDFSPLMLLIIFVTLLIPINYFVSRRIGDKKSKTITETATF